MEVLVVLQNVVDDAAQEQNVSPCPQRHPDVGHGGGTAEPRVQWIILAPRSRASITHWKPTGWFSAMFEPMIRMASALLRSCCAVVAPPRPKEVPRPGTVELCHIRAWLLMHTMPRPPLNSFLIR